MTDEASFLAAIAENPQDKNLPLIFADWLDDHGDPRGQWIRNERMRLWMGPKFENPIPKLLESLTKDRQVLRVRRLAGVIGEPMVPGLIELLDHDKARVRQQACHCLRTIGPRAKAAVPALMKALTDLNYSVREQAAKALAQIGADESAGTDQLKAALTDQNWAVRRTASKVLGAMGAKGSVLDELVERYASDDAKERAEVIEGLAQLGTAEVVPHLDKALDDPAAAVRVDAVRALGRLKFAAAVPPLCRAMTSKDASVREAAAEQFAGYSRDVPFTAEALAALTVLLGDREAHVRARACNALQRAETRARVSVPELLKNLDHDAASVRDAAAQALGTVTRDDPAVMAAVAKLVADPDLSVALSAVNALARQTKLPAAMVPGLFGFVRRVRADEGNEYHVGAAYAAFGRLDSPPPEVIEELRRALAPPTTANRYDHSWAASKALADLGPAAAPAVPELLAAVRQNRLGEHATAALLKAGPAGVAGLAALFDSTDEDVRNGAINLLWRVGAAGLPLLPAILRCMGRLGHDDWRRSRLIYGIQYIGPTATAAIPDILGYVNGPGRESAQVAVSVLRTFGAALVPHLPRLVELARDPACARWAGTFAELFANLAPHTPDVLEPLRELLRGAMPAEGDDWNARWSKKSAREQALRGLTALRDKAAAAVPDVAPLVADPETDVRRAAVNALGVLGTPAAVLPLCRALGDTDDIVRQRAAEALADRGDTADATVKALVHAVTDRTPKVRRAAVDALNKLKASTDAVRAALSEATRDDDKKVAERAAVALRKIAPKGAKPEADEPKAKAPRAKGKKKAE